MDGPAGVGVAGDGFLAGGDASTGAGDGAVDVSAGAGDGAVDGSGGAASSLAGSMNSRPHGQR
ncbi:MAG: hypothetical protein KGY81_06885 [Phycisphaerae bacterium]|jgi:hypothetical protein|nr:hypothetical protein [Phycisphaerae bacterium]